MTAARTLLTKPNAKMSARNSSPAQGKGVRDKEREKKADREKRVRGRREGAGRWSRLVAGKDYFAKGWRSK